jgi:hypothetical protein
MDLCFAPMFKSTEQVTRAGCGPTEVCMLCMVAAAKGMDMPGCN